MPSIKYLKDDEKPIEMIVIAIGLNKLSNKLYDGWHILFIFKIDNSVFVISPASNPKR